MIGQGGIAGGSAQLQDLCVLFIAVSWLCHGRSQPYVHVGVIFAPQLPPLSVMAAISVSPPFAILDIVLLRQRWGRSASQYGSASFGVELLHALVSSSFAGGSSLFVRLDAGDVGGVVDVP